MAMRMRSKIPTTLKEAVKRRRKRELENSNLKVRPYWNGFSQGTVEDKQESGL
jgi:hypothetical protein